jgi:hypothetical protein
MPSIARRTWTPVRPDLATRLTDARLQLHYAAQFGTALGISYVPPQADDSHTNLGWDAVTRALVSQPVVAAGRRVNVGIRVDDLTVLVLADGRATAEIRLHGHTIPQAGLSITDALLALGLDASRYTLRRHYELPHHSVAAGAPFDAGNSAAFVELAHWYENANAVLQDLAATLGGSEVRCWPHHFDIATLVTVAPGRATGGGLSPGDGYYDEPYLYVNAHPQPRPDRLVERLDGGGTWHTHEWIGAVLPTSRLTADETAQEAQVRSFLTSAFAACARLVGD